MVGYNSLVGSPISAQPVATPDAVIPNVPTARNKRGQFTPSTNLGVMVLASVAVLAILNVAGFKTTLAVGKS